VKVLEVLEAAGQQGGLGFSQTSATVRRTRPVAVCACGWSTARCVLMHGAADVRWVEGGGRCTGDAAGAETADHRRGHGHAGAAVPCGGVAEDEAREQVGRVDG
jgi:hypothetical protein